VTTSFGVSTVISTTALLTPESYVTLVPRQRTSRRRRRRLQAARLSRRLALPTGRVQVLSRVSCRVRQGRHQAMLLWLILPLQEALWTVGKSVTQPQPSPPQPQRPAPPFLRPVRALLVIMMPRLRARPQRVIRQRIATETHRPIPTAQPGLTRPSCKLSRFSDGHGWATYFPPCCAVCLHCHTTSGDGRLSIRRCREELLQEHGPRVRRPAAVQCADTVATHCS